MHFDLKTLKLLVAIAEERNLTRAAKREHLVVSAVSKRLADLEHQVGLPLFDRENMAPTAPCEVLLRHATTVLSALHQATIDLAQFADGQAGEVRVHANTSAIAEVLPEEIRRFHDKYPRVNVLLQERGTPSIIHAVTAGTADIGIFGSYVASESVQTVPFREMRLTVVVPTGHPLGRRHTLLFSDVVEYELISQEDGSGLNTLTREAARAIDEPVRFSAQVNSFEAIRRMVQAGLGVALLPEHCARPYVADMGLICIPLMEAWAKLTLWVGVRDFSTLAPCARLLVDHLLQH